MTEADYLKATNLAKVKIAYTIMRDTMAGYGPLTEPQRQNVLGLLSDLLNQFEKVHDDDKRRARSDDHD